ncbi:hypothetical protein EDB81DRAFT_69686 [Dactylonectria macrodidyma]|uniref:Uncharacterized protein n=1 Tax=Dactylonectria macrodidyma TaxID=307937 RepID=A0A9P9EMX5_9HYPO|nr:hypothetical protein EDB81DRAFT_69686 [Dactylonectria macrodidyma]
MAEDEAQHDMKEDVKRKPWSFFSRAPRGPSPQPSSSQTSRPPPVARPSDPSQPIRRLSAPGPSPSVEPPQVSIYKFTHSPSPAYWIDEAPTIQQQPRQAERAYPPISNPDRVDSLPLEDIPETQKLSKQGTSSQAPSAAPSRQYEPSPSLPKLGFSNLSMVDPSSGATIVPKTVVMNPAASRIKPSQGPKPPDEAVFHALVTRHGGTFVPPQATKQTAESAYQVDITPPISEREPPPRITLDPAIFQPIQPIQQATQTRKPETSESSNNTTWALPSGNAGSLVPPVSNIPMSSPNAPRGTHYPDSQWTELPTLESKDDQGGIKPPAIITSDAGFYDISKPTCSLNLICYRSGANGCDLQQVQCILRSKFPNDDNFQSTIAANPHLVHTDAQFFDEIQRLFATKMSGFFRRYFSLKSLQAFRVLAYTPTTRPVVVPFDDFVLQEMMYAYRNPSKLESKDDWVKWVFRLRRKDKRHAIEFVEGWNTTRIAIAGTIPWLSSCLVGVLWAAVGGDIQTAFTVASFILTSSSIILALLAIISSIESSGRSIT